MTHPAITNGVMSVKEWYDQQGVQPPIRVQLRVTLSRSNAVGTVRAVDKRGEVVTTVDTVEWTRPGQTTGVVTGFVAGADARDLSFPVTCLHVADDGQCIDLPRGFAKLLSATRAA